MNNSKIKTILIDDLFDSLTIPKKYRVNDVKKTGNYKVISSKKANRGVVGYTDSPDFSSECILTFGDQSRNIYIQDKPFSVTDNVKVLKLKEEYKCLPFFLEYVVYNWIPQIPNYGYSRYWKIAKKVEIHFPIDSNNNFDLEKIKEFVKRYKKLQKFKSAIEDIIAEIDDIIIDLGLEKKNFNKIPLSDPNYFSLKIGQREYKLNLKNNKNDIPIFSSNVFEPFGYTESSNLKYFKNDYILWGIDGNFKYRLMPKGEIFATTDHCGTIEILSDLISADYILYQLEIIKIKYGFDRNLRPSLTKMGDVYIDFPVDFEGNLDINMQTQIAKRYSKMKNTIIKLDNFLHEILDLNIDFTII